MLGALVRSWSPGSRSTGRRSYDAGAQINPVVGVSHFPCIGSLVEATDLVAVIPSRYAAAFGNSQIETRELPFPTPVLKYELIWHERTDRHSPHRWFRDLLLSFCSEAFPGAT